MSTKGSFFIRIYPKAWRLRYGDEFASLLEQRQLTVRDCVDVVLSAAKLHLKNRALLVACALILGVICPFVAVVLIPTHMEYTSQTEITVTSDGRNELPIVNDQVQSLLLNDDLLGSVVDKFGLYSGGQPEQPRLERIHRMRQSIEWETQPGRSGRLVDLKFSYTDPTIALAVNKALTAGVIDGVLALNVSRSPALLGSAVWHVRGEPSVVSEVQHRKQGLWLESMSVILLGLGVLLFLLNRKNGTSDLPI